MSNSPSYKRVSIQWVKAILAAAHSLGVEPKAILQELELSLDLDANEPAYLSLNQTQDIWAKCEQKSGHDYFGLMMGQRVRPAYFHAVGYVAMTSKNLLEAFENFITYMPLISEGAELAMSFEHDNVWVDFAPRTDHKPFSRHQHESVMALLLAFSRWLLGDDSVAPIKIMFFHEPGPELAMYEEVFSVAPTFNQDKTAIQFPQHILQRRLRETDAGLHALHKSHADQMLSVHGNTSWKAKVVHCINASHFFQITREDTAAALHVSTRTLQRRLQEEGTHFVHLLDEQKKLKAEKLILNSQRSLKNIALELNFSEPSTFYRACKRWFNCAPNALRSKQS